MQARRRLPSPLDREIGELCTYNGFMPDTDRIDYVAAMSCNFVWALAVERLGGYEVTRRAELLRIITTELGRISSHLISVGTMAMDIGAVTPFPYALRERERVNDLMEEICGARLTFNFHRIGGVGWDMPAGWDKKVMSFCASFDKILDEFDRLITLNHIFIERLAGVVTISAEDAGTSVSPAPTCVPAASTGTCAATSRIRCTRSWRFGVPLGRDGPGRIGDCYNRFVVRVEEMRESARLARSARRCSPKPRVRTRSEAKTSSPRRARSTCAPRRREAKWASTSSATVPEKPWRSRHERGRSRPWCGRARVARHHDRRSHRAHRELRRRGTRDRPLGSASPARRNAGELDDPWRRRARVLDGLIHRWGIQSDAGAVAVYAVGMVVFARRVMLWVAPLAGVLSTWSGGSRPACSRASGPTASDRTASCNGWPMVSSVYSGRPDPTRRGRAVVQDRAYLVFSGCSGPSWCCRSPRSS